jgi:SAM-dependent methyltransferase
MHIHSKRSTCRLCISNQISLVVELDPVPVGEHYYATKRELEEQRFPIDLYQCNSCGAVQTQDDIESDFLWDGYTYFSGQTKGILNHFSEFSSQIINQYKLKQGSKVFDIGSNDGSLLKCFKDKDFLVFGVDPSDIVAKVANDTGIPTFVGLFSDDCIRYFPEENRTADLITAFNVFAHSPDMVGMIRGVKQMLAKEGVFCFEVQYLGDIAEKKLVGTIFHEHMIHYSLTAAKKFLDLHEMKLIGYTRNSIQMGSIIFHATHKESMKPTSNEVSQLGAEEEASGLVNAKWALDFKDYISEQRRQVDKLRQKWLNQNIEVYGYGAARAGPTLAIQYGLERCIKAVFDDHSSKSGKFGVFESMEIIPTYKLMELLPKVVVILAWIHAGTIVKKNKEYLESGGKFIVLWPEVNEVSLSNVDAWLNNFNLSK